MVYFDDFDDFDDFDAAVGTDRCSPHVQMQRLPAYFHLTLVNAFHGWRYLQHNGD